MTRNLVRPWILVAAMAALLIGCGRGSRTAANDPFLDDPARLAGAHSPPPEKPAEKPGYYDPAQAHSKPHVAASTSPAPPRHGITAAGQESSDPFLAMAKPASRPNPPATGGNPFGERAAPKEQVTAQKIAPDSALAAKPVAKSRPKTLDQWENPFESGKSPAAGPAETIETAAAEKAATGTENPFDEETQVAEPRVNPVAHSKPAERPQPTNEAAPFPDHESTNDSPFGASAPKPRQTPRPKTVARATQPEASTDESPFGSSEAAKPASKPKSRSLGASEAPMATGLRPAGPPSHRPKSAAPRVQSPDDEEFEENPFATKPARTAKPAPRAVTTPEAAEEEAEPAPIGKIRLTDDSHEPEESAAETKRRPMKRYLPMPSPGESGWKKHGSHGESESTDEEPWN